MKSRKHVIGISLLAVIILIALFSVFESFENYPYDIESGFSGIEAVFSDSDCDSYIIGSSSAMAYSTDVIDTYLNSDFCKLTSNNADMDDIWDLCEYLIKKYNVENLILNVCISDAMAKDNGADNADDTVSEEFILYDILSEDAEYIGDLKSYSDKYSFFSEYSVYEHRLEESSSCLKNIRKIVSLCESEKVNLTVIASPIYHEYIKSMNISEVINFYKGMADVTDFWDFSYSSVSFDARYFYDGLRFRKSVGDMMAARIFGNEGVYVPCDFGKFVTDKDADEYFENYMNVEALDYSEYTACVPILMYHNVDRKEWGGATITAKTLEEQIAALVEAGYTSVTFDDLISYVKYGTELPKSPIVITFDDGYMSNYEYAFPILKKYNMNATIFAIGYSFGCNTYKATGVPIYPHFGEHEAREMVLSGNIDIQSHTYDMHQSEEYEIGNARTTVARFEGESEQDYINALRVDIRKSISQLETITREKVNVLAYPQGYYNITAQRIFAEEGIQVTLTTEPGNNTVIRGLPQSLMGMRRYTVSESVTPEALLEMIK